MTAFLESIDRVVAGGIRRALDRHETYADWASDIPEPMFRQLVREGVFRTFVYVCANGLLLWLMAYVWPPDLLHAVGLAIGFALLAIWNRRKLAGQCLEREFLYRRKHGNWRWE